MRRLWILLILVLIVPACKREKEVDRLEAIENRLQATEFQLATLSEIEHRLSTVIQKKEETYAEWFSLIQSARESLSEMESKMLALEQRVEAAEGWIRWKKEQEEKDIVLSTPDGKISDAWKQLSSKCQLSKAGEAQTTLNFLVRIDRYMSDFPVHHPVNLQEDDPLMCMTSNLAASSPVLADAYKERELSILKGRDQWLGYRVDRSWETRPERGECDEACCKIDQFGQWACEWGWEGGRWECEYDVEGWRNYRRRWFRRCKHLPDSKDFYAKPYLMRKLEERKVKIPDALYCVVDLEWENRIYCLSHSQYPVLQIRLPDDPEKNYDRPIIPRFTLIKITNWDVLYKDEWTSTWVIRGEYETTFPGQLAGLAITNVQEPVCCAASNPLQVVAVEKELQCFPETSRAGILESLVIKHGFESILDYETQKMGMISEPEWKETLDEIRAEGCPEQAEPTP